MSEIRPKFQRVMVIDDNPIDLYIACRLLTKHHFTEKVLQFNSAMAALAFLAAHRDNPLELPEIIMVDIYMPVISGFDFLSEYEKFPVEVKELSRIYIVSSTIDEYDIKRINEDKNIKGFGIKTINIEFLDSITGPDRNH